MERVSGVMVDKDMLKGGRCCAREDFTGLKLQGGEEWISAESATILITYHRCEASFTNFYPTRLQLHIKYQDCKWINLELSIF
jgi:hypothetical protein